MPCGPSWNFTFIGLSSGVLRPGHMPWLSSQLQLHGHHIGGSESAAVGGFTPRKLTMATDRHIYYSQSQALNIYQHTLFVPNF